MSDQLWYEDVATGDAVPTCVEFVDELQMFFFSAATYNGHRIHYDRTFATETEGHPDILVHGPLQVARIARTLTDWIGPGGRLRALSVQNRASAYPGEELRITGTVVDRRVEDGVGFLDVELREEKGDAVTLILASATVSVPSRG